MSRLIATVPLISRMCVRSLTTSQVRSVKPDLSKLKKKQLQFQVDNDVPVYLKGGSGDAGRPLCHHGTRKIRSLTFNVLRLSSTEEFNPTKSDPCSVQPTTSCPPPPCPPKPSCPPTLCPKIPDPNNPCNYCPPPCIDPDYPDLTKLKKLQCKFQEKNDIPVHLKGGPMDVYLYHASIIMTVVGVLTTFYLLYEMA